MVRLIGPEPESEQMGVVTLEAALKVAADNNLDLAEVAANVNPPVCKVLDYGKYQYHQKKVDTKHRKMQKKTEVKGVRMGFKTGDHDIAVKARQTRKFLEAGNAVKITLVFRGREAVYQELAITKLNKFHEDLQDVCNLEDPPKRQANALIMILTPKP